MGDPAQDGKDAAAPQDPPSPDGADAHRHLFGAATLAVRRRLSPPNAFRQKGIVTLAAGGLAVLALLALAPLYREAWAPATERLTTVGALVFLLAAPGYWLRLGHRSLAIALLVVALLYGAAAYFGGGHEVEGLKVVGTILAFLIFALAGFNLVFILEEMIYDAHRLVPHRHRRLIVMPFVVDLALCLAIPLASDRFGLRLPAFFTMAIITTVLLGSWWFIRLVNGIDRRDLVIRELHLFGAGILAAGLLADSIPYLVEAESLIPSVLAYLILLATWGYVSFTTLQRTHLLLRGRNAAPWAAILLAATYAIVAHGQAYAFVSGFGPAVADLFALRMNYMIVGIWIGVGFYAVRAVWRTLQLVLGLRTIAPRGRAVAQGAARLTKGVLATERVVGQAALGLYLGLDKVIPGSRPRTQPARPAGWEIEPDAAVRPLAEEEE